MKFDELYGEYFPFGILVKYQFDYDSAIDDLLTHVSINAVWNRLSDDEKIACQEILDKHPKPMLDSGWDFTYKASTMVHENVHYYDFTTTSFGIYNYLLCMSVISCTMQGLGQFYNNKSFDIEKSFNNSSAMLRLSDKLISGRSSGFSQDDFYLMGEVNNYTYNDKLIDHHRLFDYSSLNKKTHEGSVSNRGLLESHARLVQLFSLVAIGMSKYGGYHSGYEFFENVDKQLFGDYGAVIESFRYEFEIPHSDKYFWYDPAWFNLMLASIELALNPPIHGVFSPVNNQYGWDDISPEMRYQKIIEFLKGQHLSILSKQGNAEELMAKICSYYNWPNVNSIVNSAISSLDNTHEKAQLDTQIILELLRQKRKTPTGFGRLFDLCAGHWHSPPVRIFQDIVKPSRNEVFIQSSLLVDVYLFCKLLSSNKHDRAFELASKDSGVGVLTGETGINAIHSFIQEILGLPPEATLNELKKHSLNKIKRT